MYLKVLSALGLAVFLSACDMPTATAPTATPTSAAPSSEARTFLFAQAMYGDPVFDRDVTTFARAYAGAFGAPETQILQGWNTPSLQRPDEAGSAVDTFAGLAAQAVDGQDIVVVMLTSHGAPNVLAWKPGRNAQSQTIPVDLIEQAFAPLDDDQQVIILQACFSGSLIDDLRSPNRIIITAAAADRASFGCNPRSSNTWFIESLNQALAQGGSWEEIFDRTRGIVRAKEQAEGIPDSAYSNPQRFVGANMRGVWSGSL